jgi:hypothetical protein
MTHTDETLGYVNHALERIDDLKYTLQGTSSDKPINFNFLCLISLHRLHSVLQIACQL